MKYIKATRKNIDEIYELVRNTITTIYPKYYPQDVVKFFCDFHNRENILKDIDNGTVGVLEDDGQLIGTGCYSDNHITRVYVNPIFQGQGYGSYIMQALENEIASQHEYVYLDASLPASHLYEKRGYITQKHEKRICENGIILVYEIMRKKLNVAKTAISYDGKIFTPKINSENGEVNDNTVFLYQQKGNMLWASYSGGEIIKGHIIGNVSENGEIDFYYQHMNENMQLRIGKCHSIPRILKNGRIELYEEWQWLNGDKSSGSSTVVEK